MPATSNHSPAKVTRPPIIPDPTPQPLHLLHQQGNLSDDEFVFCRLLLDLPDRALSDQNLQVILGQSAAKLAGHRKALRSRRLLAYKFNAKEGRYRYQPFLYNEYMVAREMLEAIFPKRPRRLRQRARTKKPSQPQDRWIVLEQGRCAHLLREDDLFPAERTLCGLPATGSNGQPLPRLNSQPADYQGCAGCRRLAAQSSSGSSR